MATVLDALTAGTWFDDVRQPDRRLRLSRRGDGTVVLSVWRGGLCTATVQLDERDAALLTRTLIPVPDEVG